MTGGHQRALFVVHTPIRLPTTMIPKQAIEKARQGGWKTKLVWDDHYELYGEYDDRGGFEVAEYASIALDPAFWQALGKMLGWLDFVPTDGHNTWVNGPQAKRCPVCNAHRFYDLILQEEDTDAFWERIIK